MRDRPAPALPWFFWELNTQTPGQNRQFPDVSETMLAFDIAHGQRLVATPRQPDDWTSLPPIPTSTVAASRGADGSEFDYVAACAAILQAAAYQGLDPVEVAHGALLACRAVYVDALDEARNRSADANPDAAGGPDAGGHPEAGEGQ